MKKRMAGLALAAALVAIPVAPAPAQAQGTECPGCLVGCLVRWTFDFVTHGGTHPGYTCADIS